MFRLFLKTPIKIFGLLLPWLLLLGCNAQTNLNSLESIVPEVVVPDCIIKNEAITNSPCTLKDSSGKYLSSQKYSGRDIALTATTLPPTTSITYSSPGVIDKIAVTSQLPTGWSNNQVALSIDKTLIQQGGTYNPDYLAANISSGINIFGLTGSFVVTQKPYCSNTNTSAATSTVVGINTPPVPADRLCLANPGSYIYTSPYNGRAASCDVTGSTNTASCFISQNSQDLYVTNADSVPLACSYTGGVFYNTDWTAVDFGKLKSPTISGVVKNYCQVANNQYFYPDAFGGRGYVCGTIASPPCFLNIPPNQTRTVSSTTSNTTVCLEDQTDTLPSTWLGPNDEPLSKNTNQCLTASTARYVYTKAYDGRFRTCNSDDIGNCYFTGVEVSTNLNYNFTTSDNTTCRNNLNTCVSTCKSQRAACAGDPNLCFNTYSGCYDQCYAKPTTGYTACMVSACTTTKNTCMTPCNAMAAGTAKTNCTNSCNTNYTNCSYTENPKTGIWFLDGTLNLNNPTTKTLIIPAGTTKTAAAIPVSNLFNTNAIKAGVSIFGITGSFGGQGIWSSGMHRDMSVPQLTLAEENNSYAGSSDTPLPATVSNYYGTLLPYREVASIMQDDEGGAGSTNSAGTPPRATWGTTTCGLAPTFGTIDLKISDCNAKFGSDSTWDGAVSGNAGQGRWTLITRKLSTATNVMVEVWRDERTNMLWSSLVSESTNWCKASGSSNNPGVNARYREVDGSSICDQAANQNQTGSVISACLFDTGFTNTDASFTIDGKASLNTTSTPPVHWRIPTFYDFEVAEYNGIRYVMPDMGAQRSGLQLEWTGTSNSLNHAEAWVINSTDGSHRTVNRSDTAGVRCVGR